MADELVEKVARAICNAGGDSQMCPKDCECAPWHDEAKAALAAIEQAGFGVRRREPTPEMLKAGGFHTRFDDRYGISDRDKARAASVWRSMFIDQTASPPAGANEKGER